MRRLTSLTSDRGASAVLVGLLMVPLLAFAGLAIDVGGMYWENGQLQNGADAGAIAAAQICARTNDACTGATTSASGLANSNANDGLADATVSYQGGSATSGVVTVRTSTRTANGVVIDHHLWDAVQGLLGLPQSFTTEYTQATAPWGAPTSSTVSIPLTVSLCDFSPALTGARQLIQYANTNSRVACPKGTSYPPGGFGWLTNTNCFATITNGTTPGDPGNSYPNACDSTFQASSVGKTFIVPIFTSVTPGSGNNGQDSYNISGFAAFVLTGWRFSGGSTYPQNHSDPLLVGTPNDCTGSCRGIQGYFVSFVSIDAIGTTIGTPGSCPLGDCLVALIK